MLRATNKRVRLLGRDWKLRFTRYPEVGAASDGDCDPPDAKDRTMRVKLNDHGATVHETILHEAIHGACWWLSEEHVTDLARDLSAILLRPDIRKLWDIAPP